jgi:hypothetical protein
MIVPKELPVIVPVPVALSTLPVGGVFWHTASLYWGMVTGPEASSLVPNIILVTAVNTSSSGNDLVLYFPTAKLDV